LRKIDEEFNWHRGRMTKTMYLYVLLACMWSRFGYVCVLIKLTIRIPSRMSQQCLKTDHEYYIFKNITSLG